MSKGSAPVSGSAAAEGSLGTSGSCWHQKKPKQRAVAGLPRGPRSQKQRATDPKTGWFLIFVRNILKCHLKSFDSIYSFFLPSAAKEKVTMIRWSPIVMLWCDVMCFHLGDKKATKDSEISKVLMPKTTQLVIYWMLTAESDQWGEDTKGWLNCYARKSWSACKCHYNDSHVILNELINLVYIHI